MSWRSTDARRLAWVMATTAVVGVVSAAGIRWAAAQPRLAIESDRDHALVTLTFPQPVRMREGASGRELLLLFDQPLDGARLDRIATELPGWVDGVQSGYDSLLLTVSGNVRFEVSKHATTVRLALTSVTRPGSPPLTPETAEEPGTVRLSVVRARALLAAGELAAARDLLHELQALAPDDPEVLDLLAQTERQLGNPALAARLLGRLQALAPTRRDVATAAAELRREVGSRVRFETLSLTYKDADRQLVTRGRAEVMVTPAATLGAVVENRRLKRSNLQRADGSIDDFDGSRQRGEVYAELRSAWGLTHAGLFAAERTIGLGLTHQLDALGGRTLFQAAWHEPYFETAEAIADAGTRDRLRIRHDRVLVAGLTAGLGASLNSYGIDGESGLTTSIGVEGGMRREILSGDPIVTVGYSLDAEYVQSHDTRINVQGATYDVMPVDSREQHTLDMAVDGTVTEALRYSLFGGYVFDRLGGDGPTAGLNVVYAPLPELEMGVQASTSISSTRGAGSKVQSVGAYVEWRF